MKHIRGGIRSLLTQPTWVVAAFFLVISLFAILYHTIGVFAYFGEIIQISMFHALYISISAVTTVGYGDYVPVGNLTQILISIESLTGMLLMATAVMAFVTRQSDANKAIEEAAQSAEARVAQLQEIRDVGEESVFDFLRRQVDIASERETKAMLLSELRANRLYYYGSWFLFASVLGPIASIILYLDTRSAGNVGDWHILLAGVSFGFLLLSAARGLLLQRGRELSLMSRSASHVGIMQRLRASLEIRIRLAGNSPNPQQESDFAEFIIKGLMSGTIDADSNSDEGGSDVGSELLGVLQKVSKIQGS